MSADVSVARHVPEAAADSFSAYPVLLRRQM